MACHPEHPKWHQKTLIYTPKQDDKPPRSVDLSRYNHSSSQKAAEMREKIKILQNEIEILRSKVNAKDRWVILIHIGNISSFLLFKFSFVLWLWKFFSKNDYVRFDITFHWLTNWRTGKFPTVHVNFSIFIDRLLQKARLKRNNAVVIRDSLRNEMSKRSKTEEENREKREQLVSSLII